MSGRANTGSRRRQEADSPKAPAVRLVTSAATAAKQPRPTSRVQETAPPYRADSSPSPLGGERAGETGAPLRFIDLFCGIGGFRFAFERAGGQCVFSSDWDRFSQQTYAAKAGPARSSTRRYQASALWWEQTP